MSEVDTVKSESAFIGFHMSEDDARKLYKLASDNDVSVAALIRHILIDKTNGFVDVGEIPADLLNRRRRRFA